MLSELFDGHIFCVVFNMDEYVIVSIFCVGVGFPRVFLGAVGAHGASDSAGSVIQNTVIHMWRNFERFDYQLVEKPGWVWFPLGGFASLRVVSFSGESRLLVAFEVPDSLFYRRCDGRRPSSSARAFIDLTACRCTRYATHGGIEKL